MQDYGVTGMVTTAVKVDTGMLINGQDARWPHSQDGRATRARMRRSDSIQGVIVTRKNVAGIDVRILSTLLF
jgi:hypothetical protein